MTKKNNLFILIILSLFYLINFSYAATSKSSIQIKGSDTMVNLGQGWAEEFSKKNPNINVAVTGGGSGTGIASLINGTCDIAETSRSMKDKETQLAQAKGIKPVEYIVALDGIAVVVNPNNPVKNLTLDQLRNIFMGTIKNWKEVGGENKKIVILSREVNSGTHVFFKEHVLRRGNEKGPEEFSPDALLMPSSQAIADEVALNPNAVGYYGMGYISREQKLIAVAKDTKSNYIEPTITTIKNNSYPISRPLYMYTKGEPEGVIKQFMDYVYSPEGQKIVKDTDFVPVK
ncbi:MAG: phosphate ABC transporter substrate-binding protein [Candidatus Omnitrophota bacterium]